MASGAWPRHSMPSGRGPSSAWGRLKPVELDPLEAMGLPSKGETRLLDFKTQNQYYTEIVKRYLAFCSDAGGRDSLLAQFAALSVEPSSTSGAAAAAPTTSSSSSSGGGGGGGVYSLPQPTKATIAAATADSSGAGPKSKDLTVIMMALRKLREAIVASKRADDFAVQTYLFCIRLAVLVKQPESYHPAIQHLLRRINNRSQHQQQQQEQLLSPTSPDHQHQQHHSHSRRNHQQQPLTTVELQEVAGYLVLDAACRRGDLAEAHASRLRYGLHDGRVDAVLAALAHDNYAAFWRLRGQVDGHKARLMEFAEPSMRRHALRCLGRSYLAVDCSFLERCAGGRTWADLQRHDAVGWERDGQRVVIRRIKAK